MSSLIYFNIDSLGKEEQMMMSEYIWVEFTIVMRWNLRKVYQLYTKL